MPDLINGRTAEEIKLNLKTCGESSCLMECPYYNYPIESCAEGLARDAFALIAQLEAERDAALAKVPKWISVEERLPELMDDGTCDAVLTTDGYFIHMAYFFEGQWYFCDCGEMKEPWSREVTHWMPLPETPEEQKDTKHG